MYRALKGIRDTIQSVEFKLQNRSVPSSSRVVLYILSLVSFGIKSVVKLRHFLYNSKILPMVRANVYVVSVGNITVGGSGKTSFVMKIVQDVQKQVGIFTRGYRATKVSAGLVSSPEEGDEAYLLSIKLPFANVFVGKKRSKHVDTAIKMGAKYLILDDGMQHRQMARDLEVVMIDGRDPFGGGYLLPRGRLRDLPSRLRAADFIGIHNPINYEFIKKELEKITDAKIFGTQYRCIEPEKWKNKKVGAFVGIGNPVGFFEMLEELGCYIVKSLQLRDHESLKEPKKFVEKCLELGAEVVVCTEKDYVKLSYIEQIVPLGVEMQVVYDAPIYKKLVEKISEGIRK